MSEAETEQARDGLGLTKFSSIDLPEELLELSSRIRSEGLQLVTEPVKWQGFPGDEERLGNKYPGETSGYGALAWREISERLAAYYSTEDLSQVLKEVKSLHRQVLQLEQELPANKKTYYHQVGEWEKANGHVDQTIINIARQIIGALESGDLNGESFDSNKLKIFLMAGAVHDIDWSIGEESTGLGIKETETGQIFALKGMVNYGNEGALNDDQRLSLSSAGWTEEEVGLAKEIFRRADLLQVADISYPKTRHQLMTDFCLRQPGFLKNWKLSAEQLSEGVKFSADFYKFARAKVFPNEDEPRGWKWFSQFYGDGENLAEAGWKTFEELIAKNDREGWGKLTAEGLGREDWAD